MQVTLTFDNGPTPGVTDAVLDVLAERGVPATFFVVGERLLDPSARALAERAHAEGHRIGNHTLTHRVPLGEADPAVAAREVDEAQRLLGDLATDPPLFRPYGQGGAIDDRLLGPTALRRLEDGRYTCVLWNCVPRDWLDPDGWVERCLDQITLVEWPVIVVHDVVAAAMPRLPELLDRLDERAATYTQETPDSCTPLRAGRRTGAFALLGVPA
jgi:peptidoglycan/xylan/chitin deacetylase (PgdA/CDA1 family)